MLLLDKVQEKAQVSMECLIPDKKGRTGEWSMQERGLGSLGGLI
jgi:hypothetical protein